MPPELVSNLLNTACMRLRVTETREEGVTVLRIDGELYAEGIAELDRVARAAEPPLRLDLSNLIRIDPAGIETIRSLAQAGTELVGVSPYIQLRLETRSRTNLAGERRREQWTTT